MHSTYLRNFLSTAALVIVSFMMIGIAFGIVSRSVLVTDNRRSAEATSREIVRMAEAYDRTEDLGSSELRMALSAVSGSTGEHLFISDPDGVILTCSDSELLCGHVGGRLDPEVFSGLSPTEPKALLGSLGGLYEDPSFVVATPIRNAGGVLTGYLFVAVGPAQQLDVWQTIFPLFLLISMIVLLLALIFSFAGSKLLSRPLRSITDAARRFGKGDLSARVEKTDRIDEIGELTEAFNSMADAIEKSEEERREFIANVSHELKTPMTTIAGFADGILDGTIPPGSEKRYLQTISSETKRLSRLVRSMLELSRLQAGDRNALLKNSFDITEILRLTLINFADKIESRHLDVDFQVPEDPVIVLGDPDAITQVVYNLVDNAVKFSRDGTELGVTLWKDDRKAYVSVRNRGATIPEAEIPRLFDRFHKGDRSRSRDRDGVGLGLYIVKTILNNHGEDIAVTSRQGVTDFVFSLTLRQEKGKQS